MRFVLIVILTCGVVIAQNSNSSTTGATSWQQQSLLSHGTWTMESATKLQLSYERCSTCTKVIKR